MCTKSFDQNFLTHHLHIENWLQSTSRQPRGRSMHGAMTFGRAARKRNQAASNSVWSSLHTAFEVTSAAKEKDIQTNFISSDKLDLRFLRDEA
jgi:hypothetical protein